MHKRTYTNLGTSLCRLGHRDQAREAFERGGSEATACNNIGWFLLEDGRSSEAVRHFEKALELSPAYYATAGENLKRSSAGRRP